MSTYDIDIYQGQTFNLSLTLKDDQGLPISLTGQAVSGLLKTRYSDTGSLMSLGASIVSAPNGTISLNISAIDTAKLPVNYSVYDIEMIHTGNGTVTKVLAGKASIYPEVTY